MEAIELISRKKKCPRCETVYSVNISKIGREPYNQRTFLHIVCPICGYEHSSKIKPEEKQIM